MLKTILYIALGGAIGTVLRFLTTIFMQKYWENHFPLATFITNILGCFFIGLFLGLLTKHNLLQSDLKWFLITGFCGGYTTFSTFANEYLELISTQNLFIAILYICSSVIIGILAISFGLFVAKL